MSATIKNDDIENQSTAEVLPFPVAAGSDSPHVAALKKEAEELHGMPIKDLMAKFGGRKDMFTLSPFIIQVEPGFNCRDFTLPANIDHVHELARSIAEMGVREPITVFTKKEAKGIFLADGECRLRATIIAITEMGAEIKTIPCKMENQYATEADRIFSQFQRNGGKNFAPMEAAKNFLKLINFGWTVEDISKKSGYTLPRVKQILAFTEVASEEIKQMVSEGKVSQGLATSVISESKSVEHAGKVLARAVKAAEGQGKSKATAKHVGGVVGNKLNKPKRMAEIIEDAKVVRSGSNMIITLSTKLYNEFTDLLGISQANPKA